MSLGYTVLNQITVNSLFHLSIWEKPACWMFSKTFNIFLQSFLTPDKVHQVETALETVNNNSYKNEAGSCYSLNHPVHLKEWNIKHGLMSEEDKIKRNRKPFSDVFIILSCSYDFYNLLPSAPIDPTPIKGWSYRWSP